MLILKYLLAILICVPIGIFMFWCVSNLSSEIGPKTKFDDEGGVKWPIKKRTRDSSRKDGGTFSSNKSSSSFSDKSSNHRSSTRRDSTYGSSKYDNIYEGSFFTRSSSFDNDRNNEGKGRSKNRK